MSKREQDKSSQGSPGSGKEPRSGVKRTAIILAVVAIGIYGVSLYQSVSGAGA